MVCLCLRSRVKGSGDGKDRTLKLTAWCRALYLQSTMQNIGQELKDESLNSVPHQDGQAPHGTETAQPGLRVSAGAELTRHPGSRQSGGSRLGSPLESSLQRNPGPHSLSHPPSLPSPFLDQIQSPGPYICTDTSKETLTPFHLTSSQEYVCVVLQILSFDHPPPVLVLDSRSSHAFLDIVMISTGTFTQKDMEFV